MVGQYWIRTASGQALRFLFILALLLGLAPAGTSVSAARGANTPSELASDGTVVYLPFIKFGNQTDLPLMTGVTPGGDPRYIFTNVMRPLDSWLSGVSGGRSTSIYGTFIGIHENTFGDVENQLTLAWEAGYTPFVNLPAKSGDTAYEVATSAEYGTLITDWAKSFKNYAKGGTRFAYLAPLQEMNGNWVDYGGDPTNYKRVMKRFRDIFAQVGVPAQSVKWVFAPNGWTPPDMPVFEEYYPGDEYIEVVAVSSYNFGYCSGGSWKEPVTVFNHPTTAGRYLQRLYAMAPSKPIFIAQTGSTSWRYEGVQVASEKERWLRDAYAYLSIQPNLRAVIYFNISKEGCDFPIYLNDVGNPGYKDGVNNNGYKYISPSELMVTDHAYQ